MQCAACSAAATLLVVVEGWNARRAQWTAVQQYHVCALHVRAKTLLGPVQQHVSDVCRRCTMQRRVRTWPLLADAQSVPPLVSKTQ